MLEYSQAVTCFYFELKVSSHIREQQEQHCLHLHCAVFIVGMCV